MGDTLEQAAIFREIVNGFPLISHKAWEIILKPIGVRVLEMEDVLFHHNSAVMMPENPAGKSSEDGAAQTRKSVKEGQEKITGVKALALVFKQFEFNPYQRIIIAGHTDTSGKPKYNFELSQMRADNVLYLLIGDRNNWARICRDKHKVEDYQQIMKYFCETRGWPCDPGKLDDKWGPNTRNATRRFIQAYNAEYADRHGTDRLSEDYPNQINNESTHRWPTELWKAVYDLYDEDLRKVLRVTPEQLKSLRENTLKFVDDKKRIVGCGESFPIDQAERDKYRSQSNRRVVVLFFDVNEAPVINCPPVVPRPHEEKECPLWHHWHFQPLYIDPDDLYAVVYHLKFVYYDRTAKKTMPVPDGLVIQAVENGADKLTTSGTYDAGTGVYSVKVQFTKPLDDPSHQRLHFEFATKDQWIYTKDKDTAPELVTKTRDEVEKEDDPAKVADRLKYYDLPALWSSRNYLTHYDPNKVDRFDKAFKDDLKLKPFGTALTEPGKPLSFNLDDIVLLDANGKQDVKDRTGKATNAEPHGEPKALSQRSRVRILTVDETTNRLKIYETDPGNADVAARHASSLIRFRKDADGKHRNLIADPPGGVRAVVFCGQFYDVTSKRTVKDGNFHFGQNHVLGARAAVLNDADAHVAQTVKYKNQTAILHCTKLGDFDVHYLHGGGMDTKHTYSYFVVYWSSYVTADTNPTPDPMPNPNPPPATTPRTADYKPAEPAEVEEFKNIGMINCMDHWNKKEYQFEDHDQHKGGDDKKNFETLGHVRNRIILPFYLFEAFEEFELNLGENVDIKANHYKAVFEKAKFTDALEKARGGVPQSITYVTEQAKSSWMYSYKSRASGYPLSIASLRIRTREDDTARFPGLFPFDEFGETYGCLAMAHELGHATGQVDDYVQTSRKVATFGQFGYDNNDSSIQSDNGNFDDRVRSSEGYGIWHDRLTMMVKNGPIRMRHMWRFVHWINEDGKVHGSADKPLDKFLKHTQYEVSFPHTNPSLRYFRTVTPNKDPWRFTPHSGTVTVRTNTNNSTRSVGVYLYRNLDETGLNRRPVAAGANAATGNTIFKNILAVRVLMNVQFVDNTVGGRADNTKSHQWGTGDTGTTNRNEWVNTLEEKFDDNALASKFKLSDGNSGEHDPTVIRFLPGFDFEAAPMCNTYNYVIKVKYNSNDAVSQQAPTVAHPEYGKIIELGDGKVDDLFYYFFNKASGSNFAANDFTYLATWFNANVVAGGSFTVQAV